MHKKLQTHHGLRKQNKAKSKVKVMLIFLLCYGCCRVLFFMKIRMKRCVDANGECIKRETK